MTQGGTSGQDAAKPLEADPVLTAHADRGAPLLSILIHAAIIGLLIFALPYLPRRSLPKFIAPIAVTMVQSAAQDEQPQAEQPAAPTEPQAQAAAPQAQAAPEQAPAAAPSDVALPDPSYNPFTTSLEVTENTSPQAPAPVLQQAPASSGSSDTSDQTQDQSAGVGTGFGNGGGSGAGPSGIPSHADQPGVLGGDPLMHPQYLSIHLYGYVPVTFTEELHMFLIRLIQCGVVPIPAKDPNLSVEADVEFNPIGGVKSVRLTNQGQFSEPAYQTASNALMSALTNPGCAYIHLPPQYYLSSWRQVHLSFYQHVPG